MNGPNNGNGSKPIGFDPLFGPWPVEVFPGIKLRSTVSSNSSLNMIGDDAISREFKLNASSESNNFISRPCSRKIYLGKYYKNESQPLPPADCFHGQGFGIWDNLFFETGFNPDLKWGHIPDRRILAQQWAILGVKYVQTGGNSRDEAIINMWRSIDPSVEIVINPGASDTSNLAKEIWDFTKNRDPSKSGGLWTNNIVPAYNLLLANNYSPNTPPPYTTSPLWDHIHLDEPEAHGFNAKDPSTWAPFLSVLRLLLYGYGDNTSGPCKTKVSINSYDLDAIKVLMSQFSDAIQSGCLTLMPEQYYLAENGTYENRWSFWDDVARAADTNVRASDVDHHAEYWDEYGVIPRFRIRPFISPVCTMCASDPNNIQKKMDSCCNPEYLIFDVLHAMELGFAGPAIYMGNGMSQEFYNYFILASWLAGCQKGLSLPLLLWDPDPKKDGKFATYGDLYKLLDRLAQNPSLFDGLKSALASKGFTGEVSENPASCQRQCVDRTTGIPITKGRGPCCGLPPCKSQPVPECWAINIEPCNP